MIMHAADTDTSWSRVGRACDYAADAYRDSSMSVLGVSVERHYVRDCGLDIDVALYDGPTEVWMAWRGTETNEIRDIITDARGWPALSMLPELWHSGITRAGQATWHIALGACARADIVGKPLFFAGHSLGGAIALWTANMLAYRVAGTYTFGAPPVSRWSSALPHVTRIVTEGDPVPLAHIWGMYTHVGNTIYLHNDRSVSNEDKRRKYHSVSRWVSAMIKGASAHSIANYRRALHNAKLGDPTP